VTAFRVVQAEAVRQLPAKDNWPAKRVVHYTLEAGGNETLATDFIKVDDPIPEVGSTIEAELGEQDNFDKGRRKLRRPKQGGSGPMRKRDPSETRAIQRQHSQEMALRFIAIKAGIGKLPDGDFDFASVVKITDAFERDLAPPPAASDVPGDTEGLPPARDL
jgi:hypothetical protein